MIGGGSEDDQSEDLSEASEKENGYFSLLHDSPSSGVRLTQEALDVRRPDIVTRSHNMRVMIVVCETLTTDTIKLRRLLVNGANSGRLYFEPSQVTSHDHSGLLGRPSPKAIAESAGDGPNLESSLGSSSSSGALRDNSGGTFDR